MISTSSVWFPLRSNIAYFETPRSQLSLEARIKQMALLADELWFEGGVVTVDVAASLVLGPWFHPPGTLSEARIRDLRRLTKRGVPFSFSIGPQPDLGTPAPPENMREIGGGIRQRGFVAEYHLLLKKSRLLEQPWVSVGVLPAEAEAKAKQMASEADRWDAAMSDRAPRLSKNSLLDGTMKKSLNRDLAAASLVGLPTVVDRTHVRMLRFKARELAIEAGHAPGGEALSLWAPDFSERSWADIIALHDHDAIGAFRAKLIEAESEIAGLRGVKREQALCELGMNAITEALRRRFPSLRRRLTGIAIEAASGVALGRAAVLAAATKQIAEARRDADEWTAVYLGLTRRDRA